MSEDKKLGRPTDYRPEYAEQLLDYFDIDPYREVLKKIETKSGDVIEIPTEVANDFPTLAGFACKIRVHRDTLHEWSKKHPEFSDAYKMAKEFQERYLVTNGLKNLIQANFGIFTAKNVIGYRDQSNVEHSGKDGQPISFNFIENKTKEE